MNKIIAKLNNVIIRLFTLLIRLLSLLFFYTPKIFKVINLDEKNRFYRSILIRETTLLLKKVLKLVNYSLPITINKDKVIVDVDGVLIVPGNINRYYKIESNWKYHNQAKKLEELFDFSNARIFIDIGACIGEYSIYFAKKYPQSKIYSIEASEKNLELFKENIKMNKSESSIKIIENAISDVQNKNFFISENTQQSEVIISSNNSQKKTITLSSLISNEKLDKIDFLKIDIESSNYKLAQCIVDNSSKINAIQYEFAKGPSNIFINLIDQVSNVYDFYLNEEEKFKVINKIDLKNKIKSQGSYIADGFDVFFKKNKPNYKPYSLHSV
jgi:FkbM family methyltransferase